MPGKEKGDTEVPPNSHSTVVIQVSLLELVSSKCTEKEKDDTEVPSHSYSAVYHRFTWLSSSPISVREMGVSSGGEATSRHPLVTP
jgi:hypothetical protein